MTIQELLTDETKWTQSAYARLASGEPCSSVHPEAVCWCLIGAVNRCYGGPDILSASSPHYDQRRTIEQRLRAAIEQTDPARYGDPASPWYDCAPELHSWNDDHDRTFAEVRRIVEVANV